MKLVYDDGSETQTRFCLGIFFDRERILASNKCLRMKAYQNLLSIYGGFSSFNFDIKSNISETNPHLVEYGLRDVDKKVK